MVCPLVGRRIDFRSGFGACRPFIGPGTGSSGQWLRGALEISGTTGHGGDLYRQVRGVMSAVHFHSWAAISERLLKRAPVSHLEKLFALKF